MIGERKSLAPRRRDQPIRRHQFIHQAQVQGFARRNRLAAEQHAQAGGGADQARQPLRTASAGQQAQFDFRQPQLDRWIVSDHTGVAGHANFKSPAQRQAVDGGDEGLGTQLQPPEQASEMTEQFAQFVGAAAARSLGEHLDHLEVGAGQERGLTRGQHHRPDRGIGLGLRDDPLQRVHQLPGENIHRPPRHVDAGEKNPVGVEFGADTGLPHEHPLTVWTEGPACPGPDGLR